MRRPRNLAEVVDESRDGDRREFAMCCDEFCDAFYLDYPDKALMQAHIDPAPPLTGDAERDAWIGAIGEHLAQRWDLATPAWTARSGHFALEKPVFMPPSKALQTLLLCESPPAFRSRLIFTGAEPLQRARFPADVPKIRMPWDDRERRPSLRPLAGEGVMRSMTDEGAGN